MYYYGARYYEPRECRFYGVDPLKEKYPNMSPFIYTFNNPVRFIDPTGMEGEEPPTYALPKNPDNIDKTVWEPIERPKNIPETPKSNNRFWKNKNSEIILVWDDEGHYHSYTNTRLKHRFDIDGNVLKDKKVRAAHLYGGETFKLSNAIRNMHSIVFFVFDITAILTDSPQNPLYIFQPRGTGKQNRAYYDIETNQIYEWNIVSGTKIREVRFYNDYDIINHEWRGVGYKNSQYFDEKGQPIKYPML